MSSLSNEDRRALYDQRIAQYKEYLGGRCAKCGATEDLEFDHKVPGSRKFVITTNFEASWVVMKAELDKCQLLCREHHIEKSRECGEMKSPTSHGSSTMYRHHNCRCEICRMGQRDRMRAFKARRALVLVPVG